MTKTKRKPKVVEPEEHEYSVLLEYSIREWYTVEATNEAEAQNKAMEAIEFGPTGDLLFCEALRVRQDT